MKIINVVAVAILLIVSPSGGRVGAQSDAVGRMNNAMAANPHKILEFDDAGNLKRTYGLSPEWAEMSLKELLQSSESPVKGCKDPTPTPPPGCVVCKDGHPIICVHKNAQYL